MAVMPQAIAAAVGRRGRARRRPARLTHEERREAESAIREHPTWTTVQQTNIAFWNSTRDAPYQIKKGDVQSAATWSRIRDYIEERKER